MKPSAIVAVLITITALIIVRAADYPPVLQGSTSGYQAIIGTGNQTNVAAWQTDNYKYHTLAMVNAPTSWTNGGNPVFSGTSNTTTASYTLDGTN